MTRRWERAGTSRWPGAIAAWLVPGLALAVRGRRREALAWIGVSAAVIAVLLALGLTARVWPVAVLLMLPAWLVAAPLAVRAAQRGEAASPSTGMTTLLGLLHWAPALVVLAVTAPGWILLDADNPASLPVLAPGEMALCRADPGSGPLERGSLVVAGAAGERFLGRILGLPGEGVEAGEDGWRLDGVPTVRAERDLLLPSRKETDPGTRSLVVRVSDSYLSLWSRGPVEENGEGASVELTADEVYVLALDQRGGASLDSRARGAFPLARVRPARCLLLWSPHRLPRVGRPIP
ncbi:MAG: S26 family signal peptidase [Pseudomonadota bacterium]